MVNIEEFTGRLQMLLDYYHLTASAFADSIDVQRSGISHILSGRNKPSLDFVLKVTNVYTDVTIPWLLFGEGSFPPNKSQSLKHQKVSDDLFTDNNSEATSDNTILNSQPEAFTTSNVDAPVDTLDKEQPILPPTIPQSKGTSTEKQISKIVFFYKDNTFETYYPHS